ncbi:hypothetical protein Q9966_006835 [Columba livia]|nr:hypothetical protein Q9966_006835 [Columba livia]
MLLGSYGLYHFIYLPEMVPGSQGAAQESGDAASTEQLKGSQEALWLIVERHTAQTGAGEVKGGFLPFFCGAGFPWAVMPV